MLGKNIKELRQKRKLSQEKLARLTNISLNTLTKIESGFTKRPSIQTIHKIAKVLVVSLDELVEGAKARII
jgi:transcriptional regulator with XRE-family HTH domain